MIGTRSALFTPFKNLGVIVIDEEHDSSYKQQEGWRYHARDRRCIVRTASKSRLFLAPQRPRWKRYATSSRKIPPAAPDPSGRECASGNSTCAGFKGQKVQAGLAPALITRMRQHLQADNRSFSFLTAVALRLHCCATTVAGLPNAHVAITTTRCIRRSTICAATTVTVSVRCRASALPAVPRTGPRGAGHRTA